MLIIDSCIYRQSELWHETDNEVTQLDAAVSIASLASGSSVLVQSDEELLHLLLHVAGSVDRVYWQ